MEIGASALPPSRPEQPRIVDFLPRTEKPMTLPDPLELIQRRDVATAAVRSASRERSSLLPHTRIGAARTLGRTAPENVAAAIRDVLTASYSEDVLDSDDAVAGRDRYWLIGGYEGDPRTAFPAFGPAVAWIDGGGAVACAVQIPTFDETFSAARGQGAALNGRRIAAAAPRRFNDALILSTQFDIAIPSISQVVTRLVGWRMPSPQGGLLPLFCYLATGRIDGFLARAGSRIDVAVGTLLVEEAGGSIRAQVNGDRSSRETLIAAAATPELLEEMLVRSR
jgi:myo-inositol-1(or 4)-monophosphatase